MPYKDKEEKKRYNKAYADTHKEQYRAYWERYREINKEYIMARNKKHEEEHKEERNSAHKKWRWENLDKNRHYRIRKYGITKEDYDSLLDNQGGLCAICGKEETYTLAGKPRPLSIDHDHETGIVRGLLCNACNRAIGLMRNNPDIAMSAAEYLIKSMQHQSDDPRL